MQFRSKPSTVEPLFMDTSLMRTAYHYGQFDQSVLLSIELPLVPPPSTHPKAATSLIRTTDTSAAEMDNLAHEVTLAVRTAGGRQSMVTIM